MRFLSVFVCILALAAFVPAYEQPCAVGSLFKASSFPVGVAVNSDKLSYDERYVETAISHFNSFTPEMLMKPRFMQPKKGSFSFGPTDDLIAFCSRRKIRLHGHALVWHTALPSWMEHYKGSREEWEALLKDHVETVVKHCRHYVRSWDVVNEAFNDDGSLRNTVWLRNIGESYIEKAFRFAQEADPSATLFYNDFSLEENTIKLRKVLKFLDELREKGVKIDGIGLQMHIRLDHPRIREINAAAREIERHGYLVHYSELDISLTGNIFISTKKLQQQQKQRYYEVIKGYMALKPESRFGITLWGVGDEDSWLSEENTRSRPLLFNTHYRPKPAFCGFAEGLAP